MKTKLSMLLGLIFCFAMTLSAFAYSPISYIGNGHIAIGGVSLTSTEAYVQSIYGEPDKVSYEYDPVTLIRFILPIMGIVFLLPIIVRAVSWKFGRQQ